MPRNAADIMLTDFDFVDCDATVAEAEELLLQQGLTILPVLNPDRTVFGILTQQNLLDFYRRSLNNPKAFHAWEICDARPLLTKRTTALRELAGVLLANPSRHALVVDGERHLFGVISAELLLQHYAAPHKSSDRDIDRTPLQAGSGG